MFAASEFGTACIRANPSACCCVYALLFVCTSLTISIGLPLTPLIRATIRTWAHLSLSNCTSRSYNRWKRTGVATIKCATVKQVFSNNPARSYFYTVVSQSSAYPPAPRPHRCPYSCVHRPDCVARELLCWPGDVGSVVLIIIHLHSLYTSWKGSVQLTIHIFSCSAS